MDLIGQFFDAAPLAAVFVTVALGYFVGKFKVGRFVPGGIAGTVLAVRSGPRHVGRTANATPVITFRCSTHTIATF